MGGIPTYICSTPVFRQVDKGSEVQLLQESLFHPPPESKPSPQFFWLIIKKNSESNEVKIITNSFRNYDRHATNNTDGWFDDFNHCRASGFLRLILKDLDNTHHLMIRMDPSHPDGIPTDPVIGQLTTMDDQTKKVWGYKWWQLEILTHAASVTCIDQSPPWVPFSTIPEIVNNAITDKKIPKDCDVVDSAALMYVFEIL